MAPIKYEKVEQNKKSPKKKENKRNVNDNSDLTRFMLSLEDTRMKNFPTLKTLC